METPKVEMMCMTTKNKFLADNPPVVVLANGRYAYRVECPWKGKNDKTLYAFKFCSSEAHMHFERIRMQEEREAREADEPERPDSPCESCGA